MITPKTRSLMIGLAMLAAILACNVLRTAPQVSNIRMATDESGKTATSSYAPDASFFLYADLKGLAANQVLEARWYAINADGVAQNSEINSSIYKYQPGIEEIYFRLDPSGGPWPTGSYRVEVFLDGQKVGEQGFSVQ